MISDNKVSSDNIQIIKRYKSQELEILSKNIGFGGSASVDTAKWMKTSTTYAIKRFHKSTMNDIIINEVYLMGKVICHPNIIKICGVTTLEGETNYSIVLEFADSGTLGDYLRKNAATFKWEDQLKFAKDITSGILCLHRLEIIHGDLHPGNILIHQHTIKIADFGRSRINGSAINKKEKAYGVMCYMDPKILNDHLYDLNKKSDIYSLAVIFWQLTSCKLPFESEKDVDLKILIINGKREIPVLDTDSEYVKLYQRGWKLEPDDRPDISDVVDILNSIGFNINSHSIDYNSFSSEKNNSTINSEETKDDNISCQISIDHNSISSEKNNAVMSN